MHLPKIRKITIKQNHFKRFIHLNFIIGVLYAFYHFVRTPKAVDMATRRMWAYETWIVFTLYSIFIYLFSIEVASENGEPILHKLFRIRRKIKVKASGDQIQNLFDYIVKNPDAYSFDTHEGITRQEGDITQKGTEFETKEKFLLFPIKLTFQTVRKTDRYFIFKLIKPLGFLDIKGRFSYKRTEDEELYIYLTVYSKAEGILQHLILSLIFILPIRLLISRQLVRELRFIKKSLNK